jgi:hypothetical protein
LIEKLQAYRTGLLKAGRLLEARAAARCIKIAAQNKSACSPIKTGASSS